MDAQDEIIEICRKYHNPALTGIAHGFQGTLKDLHAWLDLGFYISIGAESLNIWRSIKKAPPVSIEVMRAIPAERLLTETDCMFFEEVPHGVLPGSPDKAPPAELEMVYKQPADVLRVAEKIAEMRGESPVEIGKTATQNLKRLLKVT